MLSKIKKPFNYKVNYHFIETCNMNCKYCFAKMIGKEISDEEKKKLITRISKKFKAINFVGGEPLLRLKTLEEMVDICNKNNCKPSVVTNGSMFAFNIEKYRSLILKLDTIGISINSLEDKTLIKIGNCLGNNQTFSDKYLTIITTLREINPNIKIKINTVVEKFNYKGMELAKFIDEVKPYKWKIMKVINIDNHGEGFEITDQQYHQFIDNNKLKNNKTNVIIEAEGEMINSYIMIHHNGSFVSNSNQSNCNLISYKSTDTTIKQWLDNNLDLDKYNKRYEFKQSENKDHKEIII